MEWLVFRPETGHKLGYVENGMASHNVVMVRDTE